MKLGEIVPAKVSRVLSEGHYAITVRGETVHAQSHLALNEGELFVVVESLRPKIRLRLVPVQSSRSAEAMIRLALEHGLPLDPQTQQVLLALIEHGSMPPDIEAFVGGCHELSGLLPHGSQVSWELLLALATLPGGEGPPALDVLLELFSMRDTLLPEPFTLPVPDEDAMRYAWLLLRLDGVDDAFRLAVAPSPLRGRLERWRSLLGALNAVMEGVQLQAWLLPENGRLRLALAELHSSGGVDYCRLWVRTDVFNDIRVQLQWTTDTSRATLGFDNSVAARDFGQLRDSLRQEVAATLPGCGLHIEVDHPLGGRP